MGLQIGSAIAACFHLLHIIAQYSAHSHHASSNSTHVVACAAFRTQTNLLQASRHTVSCKPIARFPGHDTLLGHKGGSCRVSSTVHIMKQGYSRGQMGDTLHLVFKRLWQGYVWASRELKRAVDCFLLQNHFFDLKEAQSSAFSGSEPNCQDVAMVMLVIQPCMSTFTVICFAVTFYKMHDDHTFL